eukprot:365389-Chlamydomonas_euryale.AAC.7
MAASGAERGPCKDVGVAMAASGAERGPCKDVGVAMAASAAERGFRGNVQVVTTLFDPDERVLCTAADRLPFLGMWVPFTEGPLHTPTSSKHVPHSVGRRKPDQTYTHAYKDSGLGSASLNLDPQPSQNYTCRTSSLKGVLCRPAPPLPAAHRRAAATDFPQCRRPLLTRSLTLSSQPHPRPYRQTHRTGFSPVQASSAIRPKASAAA